MSQDAAARSFCAGRHLLENEHSPSSRAALWRIFVADDDADMRALLAEQLRDDGHDVSELRDGFQLLERLQAVRSSPLWWPDAIVSDVRMPGHSGLELLAALRRAGWTTPVVLITAFGDRWLHDQAKRRGAAAVLDKPFDIEELRTVLRFLRSPN
ncbi:response regulator [soil metagenome]